VWSYFNIATSAMRILSERVTNVCESGLDLILVFRTNVVSKLADRLKIRTNRITSEPAEVNSLTELADAKISCFKNGNQTAAEQKFGFYALKERNF